MVSQARHAVANPRLCARTFGVGIGIPGAISAWRCCECEVNSADKNNKTANTPPYWHLADQSEFNSGGIVSAFPYVWQVAVVIHTVFASSWGIRQSKLPTQHVQPESGRWFPLCVLFKHKEMWVIWGTQALNRSVYCICDLSWLM